MASAMTMKSRVAGTSALTARVASRPAARAVPRRQVTQAISDTNLVISGATAASLALGRFVLLPIQRKFNDKAGRPTQNGVPHEEAGDRLAAEATWLLKSNDPENFNIVDVFAWGAIGHALGYLALATASLNVNHIPKF